MSKRQTAVTLKRKSKTPRHQLEKEAVVVTETINRAVLPEAVKRAIVQDALEGMERDEVALCYGVGRSTVDRLVREFKHETAEVRAGSHDNWVQSVRSKARTAIEAGLDCPRDPYRRAQVGIKLLEGVRDLRGDETNVQVNNLILSTPDGWRDRYVGKRKESESKEVTNGGNGNEQA